MHNHIIDTAINRYYVETWFDNSCKTRSYYAWNPTPLNIDELDIEQNLVIYPNPTKSHIYYQYEGDVTINVIDIYGNIVNVKIDYSSKKVMLTNLASGIYFFILHDNNKRFVKRFIISL